MKKWSEIKKKKKATKPESKKLKGPTELVLRTVDKNRLAQYNEFKWPAKGYVECADWSPAKVCGQGLHGCLKGLGDATLLRWDADALWQVVEVERDQIVDLGGKVKFPRGVVLYTGSRGEATKMISERYPGEAVIGATVSAGDSGTATAGYGGTATAGDSGTATAGDSGTATAGVRGTATAGYGGTATAGYGGTATAGYGGTATAGDSGIISIRRYDYNAGRYREIIGYIGEGGLKPNTKYRLNDAGVFEAVK